MARRTKKETAPITIHDEHGGVLAQYPSELVETIKSTVAKDATDEELYMFLSVANQYDLNPFMKEIYFAKMNGQVAILTSKDGYKKLAERKPNFRKCQSMVVHENDEFEMEVVMGEVVNITHKFKQKERGNIIGAYAVLKTLDHDNYVSYVSFREYDKRNSIWKAYPSAMIKKVAENEVYKNFADISGLNAYENMPTHFRNELVEEEIDFGDEEEPISIQSVIEETIEDMEE